LHDLAGEVSADISSLGVNATTDSAKESDGRTTETIARDELKELADVALSVMNEEQIRADKTAFEAENQKLKEDESKTNKAETEDLTALEGSLEASEAAHHAIVFWVGSIFFETAAEIGGLHVRDGGNGHAKVASGHRRECTNEEGESGVREGETYFWGINSEVDDQ